MSVEYQLVEIAGVFARKMVMKTMLECGPAGLGDEWVPDGYAFSAVFGANSIDAVASVAQEFQGIDDDRIWEQLSFQYRLIDDFIEQGIVGLRLQEGIR